MNKTEGWVKRPNHHELDDEQNKVQINQEIEKCICCKSKCNTHCPYEQNIVVPHCSSKGKSPRGNARNYNSKMGKILDGLPVSLGQTQHEQIQHQWPNSVPKRITCITMENQHKIPTTK